MRPTRSAGPRPKAIEQADARTSERISKRESRCTSPILGIELEPTTTIADIVTRIGDLEAQQSTIAGAVEEQSATARAMSEAAGVLAGSAQASAEVVTGVQAAAGSLSDRAARLREVIAARG